MSSGATCSVDGCGNPYRSKGYCLKHYMRVLRTGSPELDPNRPRRKWVRETQDLATRIMSHVLRDEVTNCLRWQGSVTHKGYGLIRVSRRTRSVHRVAYELWKGPIAPGLVIDHVRENGCRYRDCIEPSHLEAVTQRENVLRYTRTLTHCAQGHEFNSENTIVKSDGRRSCRICRSESRRRQKNSERRRELNDHLSQ